MDNDAHSYPIPSCTVPSITELSHQPLEHTFWKWLYKIRTGSQVFSLFFLVKISFKAKVRPHAVGPGLAVILGR